MDVACTIWAPCTALAICLLVWKFVKYSKLKQGTTYHAVDLHV